VFIVQCTGDQTTLRLYGGLSVLSRLLEVIVTSLCVLYNVQGTGDQTTLRLYGGLSVLSRLLEVIGHSTTDLPPLVPAKYVRRNSL